MELCPRYVVDIEREKCLSLTGDVDVELVLDILAAVVQDALVGALVLLLEVLHAQDDGAGLSVGPGLEAASLALGGQVFEPLFLDIYYKDNISCIIGANPEGSTPYSST